jgi:heptaprenyl diphosphate synthase
MALVFLAVVFLIIPNFPVRTILFFFFWLLALVTGKKTRPLFTIISITVITICNLYPPFGKIIYQTGPFTIAEGSLFRGLQRAVTMEGLLMFSKLVPGSVLPLPGKIGRLMQESFGILEQMNMILSKEKIIPVKDKKNILNKSIQNLDRLLLEISYSGKAGQE